MRARPWLALSVLGISSLAGGATLDGGLTVRASLDDEAGVVGPPAPRRIRHTLDEAAPPLVPAPSSNAAFPPDGGERAVLPPLPQRVFRISLDQDEPALSGRLIRLSLDEGQGVYGRLTDGASTRRRVRTSLD